MRFAIMGISHRHAKNINSLLTFQIPTEFWLQVMYFNSLVEAFP